MCLVLDSLHKHSVGVQLNYSMHVGLAVAKHDIVVACDGICMGMQNTSMRIKAVQCKDKTVANSVGLEIRLLIKWVCLES